MADPKPTRVDEFPLIFDPHHGLKINYFKNLRDEEWSFKKTKQPLHLWQKNVNPTPEGGSVIVDMFAPTKKSAREWSVVRKTPKPLVHEQAWTLLSADGSSYTLTLDQNQGIRNVLITPGNQRFDVVKLDHEYRMTKDRPEQDMEACEQKMMENIDSAYRDRLKLNKRYVKQVESDEKKQNALVKDSIKNGLLDDDIAYMVDDAVEDEDGTPFGRRRGRKKSGDDDSDIEELIKQRRADNHEELDVDAPHGDRSDDDEVMDIDDDEDEELMQELFADPDDFEEEDEDEDEKKKRKKEEKEEKETPKPVVENVPTRTVEEIAIAVTGPRNVKEEELVRYFLDVGQATQRQLIGRFKSQLQTPEQKKAFKILIQKKCTLVKRQSGDEVFRLKQRK